MKITRRSFIATSVGGSLLSSHGIGIAGSPPRTQRLRYARPARRWEEALPIGNGRFGAMVFGRVAQERLQLNEDTLWAGSPYTPDNPDALIAIPQVRRLIERGEYQAATELASAKVMAKPLQQMSYGTLGDVFLDFHTPLVPHSYERSLDLGTAITSVSYASKNQIQTREVFASAPHQVLVMQIEARKGALDFELRYRGPRTARYTAPDYQGSATALVDSEHTDWMQIERDTEANAVEAVKDGETCLLFTGINEAGPSTPSGLRFALRIKVLCDGVVDIADASLSIKGARQVTILIASATSYVNYHDMSGDPIAIVRQRIDAAAKIPYRTLRREHVREYRSLYGSASIDLQGAPSATLADQPTDERVAAAAAADNAALTTLYFQYARYLMISSSRPGCQPANLQGLWNEGTNPPWGSKYTININTEMNYWPADAAGLGACVEPLLQLVEDISIRGAQTARTMYGARGWVAHHNTDLWRATAPIDGPLWGLWPCGGAWLCNSLWDHYDYQRDTDTLKRIYPLLQGASQFFLDVLQPDTRGRGLMTSPSLSPENVHPFGSSVCAGPAMDRQIVRDLFAHTEQAARLLDDEAFAVALAKARLQIAPDQIGAQGQLQEWLEDWDAAAPDQHHRHVSHLYGVYPSSQINVRDTPALIDAAKTSLRQRGDLATGWGTAWRLCLWARMGEAEHAHSILKALLGPERTYPNLFDAHPPFQIDGNFGGAAGILEMLVQSWGDEIRLLPALPAAWPAGSVRGIRVRGGMKIDLRWARGKLTECAIHGLPRASVRLRNASQLTEVSLDHHGWYRFKPAFATSR